MEDFVSYELAVKLKEKGFKEKCLAYYDIDDNVGLLHNTQYGDEYSPYQYTDLLQSHNTDTTVVQPDDSENCCDAPTISQVLKWLREEKIYVEPCILADADTDTDGKVINEYTYWSFSVTHIETGDMIYFEYERIDDKRFDSYELAALAGIEYCLDNLI